MVSDNFLNALLLLLHLEKVFRRLLSKRIEVASYHALHGVIRPDITTVLHFCTLLLLLFI